MPSKRHKSPLGSYHIPALTISLHRILATLAPCSQPVATALPKRSTQLTRSTREIKQFSSIKLDNSYENQTAWSVSYLEQLNLVKRKSKSTQAPGQIQWNDWKAQRFTTIGNKVEKKKKHLFLMVLSVSPTNDLCRSFLTTLPDVHDSRFFFLI